jgi:hypothetical protein
MRDPLCSKDHFTIALSQIIKKTSCLLLMKHAQVLKSMAGVRVLASGANNVEFEIEATDAFRVSITNLTVSKSSSKH